MLLQHSPLPSLSCFIFSSCFFMSHDSPQQSCLASEFASPSFFISHESLSQHDSIAQQLSVFFFCSPCEGVWAETAANATSSKPSRRIRIVFFRGFIVVLLFLEIDVHMPVKHTCTQPELNSRQISRSEKHNNE